MVTRITRLKRPQKRKGPPQRRKREELAIKIILNSIDSVSEPICEQSSKPGVAENCYTHARLERSRDIRVMALHLTSDDEICFDLEVVSLDNAVGYCAVSYAWRKQYEDGSHLTHTVRCGEYSMTVTAHLHAGLRRIRQAATDLLKVDKPDGSSKILLWIDAICIDQANSEERSHQVKVMAQIYGHAGMTIVWLGEEDYEGEFEVLSEICNDARAQNSFNSQGLNLNLTAYDEWASLERLFSKDWFSRRWTVQECLLSTLVTLLLGPGSLSLSNMVFTRVAS